MFPEASYILVTIFHSFWLLRCNWDSTWDLVLRWLKTSNCDMIWLLHTSTNNSSMKLFVQKNINLCAYNSWSPEIQLRNPTWDQQYLYFWCSLQSIVLSLSTKDSLRLQTNKKHSICCLFWAPIWIWGAVGLISDATNPMERNREGWRNWKGSLLRRVPTFEKYQLEKTHSKHEWKIDSGKCQISWTHTSLYIQQKIGSHVSHSSCPLLHKISPMGASLTQVGQMKSTFQLMLSTSSSPLPKMSNPQQERIVRLRLNKVLWELKNQNRG